MTLADVNKQFLEDVQEAFVDRHVELMAATQRRLSARAPRRDPATGRPGQFRASITPYGATGSGPGSQFGTGSYRSQGLAAVRRALQGWKPGQPSGHETHHPGAARIASGSTRRRHPRATNSWMLRAVDDAVDSVGGL